MTIKPVETIKTPGYPDKYGQEARHALASAKPRRWTAVPLVTGILSATVALSLSGCAERITMGSEMMPIPSEEVSGGLEHIIMGDMPMPTPAPYAALIPLFEYGEGTGTIGCMSVAAPVFMSEDEAVAILKAAFAEAGLTLSQNAGTLEEAYVPVTEVYFTTRERGEIEYPTEPGALRLDGWLEEQGLPVVFVSTKDVNDWQTKNPEFMSSVMEYNVRQTAQVLAESNPGLVVFYDPLAQMDYDALWLLEQEDGESESEYNLRWDALRRELRQATIDESKQLLVQQAEAFIDWLCAVGLA